MEEIVQDSKRVLSAKKVSKKSTSKKSVDPIETFCQRLKKYCKDIELRNPIIMEGCKMERQ